MRAIAIAALVLSAAACAAPGNGVPEGSQLVAVGEGVARDPRSGLEWTRHDDATGRRFEEAEAYCRSLSLGGAGGWRLPEIAELRVLYGASVRSPCGTATCAIDPAITLGSPYVWSSTEPGPNTRTYLDFQFGTELSPTIGPRLLRRTLCVRSAAR